MAQLNQESNRRNDVNETRYPLCWPKDWKRTQGRTRAQFGKAPRARGADVQTYVPKSRLSIEDSFRRIEYEMERFGVDLHTVLVSTNLRTNMRGMPTGATGEPSDPGVAVYWNLKGKSQCMAIDRYDRVADNLAAVAATLEALRAIERHGGGSILERAFLGFAQLPAALDWRAILCIHPQTNVTEEIIDNAFKALAIRRHPDKGGSTEMMAELNRARGDALAELRR